MPSFAGSRLCGASVRILVPTLQPSQSSAPDVNSNRLLKSLLLLGIEVTVYGVIVYILAHKLRWNNGCFQQPRRRRVLKTTELPTESMSHVRDKLSTEIPLITTLNQKCCRPSPAWQSLHSAATPQPHWLLSYSVSSSARLRYLPHGFCFF